MDTLIPEQRSWTMRQVRGNDTGPEKRVRSWLFSHGFRYRKNDKRLPGSPDVVLPKYKTVIFVHGCFWHRHGCKHSTMPKTNVEYWEAKFTRNVERDKNNNCELKKAGWNVIIIWECELQKRIFEETMIRVSEEIKKAVP